jgi:hypothetical protein
MASNQQEAEDEAGAVRETVTLHAVDSDDENYNRVVQGFNELKLAWNELSADEKWAGPCGLYAFLTSSFP